MGDFLMSDVNNMFEELKQKFIDQENKISRLENELAIKEKKIKLFPQLSFTSLGQTTSDGKVNIRNWFKHDFDDDEEFCNNIWLCQFLRHHFPNQDYKINFIGIYGEHDDSISRNIPGKKVFYSCEDVNLRSWPVMERFGYYGLSFVDLALGTDLITHPKYFRFPYWVLRNFSPYSNEEAIEDRIEYLNSRNYEKTKNVSQISSHDWGKTRSKIADDVEKITKIDYAGKWRNNTSELWETYNDNKLEFLKQYKFNICAENVNDTGYITEKLFEAIDGGCIPLYIGGGDYLEPKVLNKNAILLWNMNGDNTDTIELFKTLLFDEESYKEFKEQPPLLDSSSKYINKIFAGLKKSFERLIFE